MSPSPAFLSPASFVPAIPAAASSRRALRPLSSFAVPFPPPRAAAARTHTAPRMTAARDLPPWAGSSLLSSLVNALINFPPLYALMKLGAKRVMVRTAETRGVPWSDIVSSLQSRSDALRALAAALENPAVAYPDYYLKPFHAYDKGNLCWEAAFEAEPATRVMALRVWKDEPQLAWQDAQWRLRRGIYDALLRYGPSVDKVKTVLDVGCSIGVSTMYLKQYYEEKGADVDVTGLDLSPYMLAVAKHNDTKGQVTWVHGVAEQSPFADGAFDVITLQFVTHELPTNATKNIFKETFRICRKGGAITVTDNDPKSPVIQGLPPVLFTLMKSTEPWSDEYYTIDMEAALKEAGFTTIVTVASDIRHRTIVARKE